MVQASVTVAVEGIVDEAVIRAVCAEVGAPVIRVYGKQGKQHLDAKLLGYNNAARFAPWLVVRDLNSDAECAPNLARIVLPHQARHMSLRIAVRQIEAWLLADSRSFASYFSLRVAQVPRDPDSLADAKAEVIRLAARSRKSGIRQDMVPRSGSGAVEGPAYASRMMEFARNHWQPRTAARHSDSLSRCMEALERLRM